MTQGVWARVAAQAHADPHRVAVTGTADATYGQLAARVVATAGELRGVAGAGDIVAVAAATSLDALVAILAVRCAGAAFLPLDVSAPAAWQELLVKRAGARAVLRAGAPGQLGLEPIPGAALGTAVPHGTVYLIFTSGSTGQPKGVLVGETALASRLDALARVPGFHGDQAFLAMTALSFDISLAELLLPLRAGGRVVLAPQGAQLDPLLFAEVVAGHRPDVLQATPSFWRLALAAGWPGAPGAAIWCGGEPLGDSLATALRPLCRELWNVYGPTEATIWASAARVDGDRPVSLGAPLPGSAWYLVGSRDEIIAEPGRAGEIVLGGAGLAIGYLGEQPASARFTTLPGIDGRVYRTGDRGAYRIDGTLEFLGRGDGQVKLRGHRLELGDVEAALETHPDVHQAVVFLCDADDPKRAHLAAVIGSPSLVGGRELRRWLADRFPPVMVPKRIDIQPCLPRTSAGKVDRVSLRRQLSAVGAKGGR